MNPSERYQNSFPRVNTAIGIGPVSAPVMTMRREIFLDRFVVCNSGQSNHNMEGVHAGGIHRYKYGPHPDVAP